MLRAFPMNCSSISETSSAAKLLLDVTRRLEQKDNRSDKIQQGRSPEKALLYGGKEDKIIRKSAERDRGTSAVGQH